ncbi:uncharacterized protein LOC110977292 [Acanthaster planci]|uniref:Uncharacterized protein LOC110977292 n=1 Tax=Acanthaster planci TaxID=133434 RepID=A0A8B7Y3S5_ACAPL|nr:uncharacterized protein LOC110977292 [Acanthaster planci]
MSLNADLLRTLLDQLSDMIGTRKEMIDWLKDFIDDIKTQEIAINSTKTGAAALGVISTIGLFTPFAPLAIGGLVASGGAAVATTIGDLIANKVKSGNLEEKVDSMKKEDSDLQDLHKKIKEQADKLAKELKISTEEATLFLLVGVPKMVVQASLQVAKGVVEIQRILPHLQAMHNAMKLGASLTQAARLGATTFQGGRLTVTGVEGGAAIARTTLAVTTSAKVLGGFGAVIGVADAIYSWSTKNPNRNSAENLLPQVEGNLKALEKIEKEFLELKEL